LWQGGGHDERTCRAGAQTAGLTRERQPGSPPSAAPRRLPDWSAVPSTSEGHRELLGYRIAYFGRVFFVLSLVFYVRNVTLIALTERVWPPFGNPALVLHLAAIGVSGLQWILCRQPARTSTQLAFIDAGGLLLAMSLYGLLTVAEASSFEHAVAVQSAGAEVLLVALITVALVTTHAIIVPATVARMFWLSAATAALGPVAAYAVAVVGFPEDYLRAHP